MEKLVYLIYERPSIDPAALRARFLDDVAPRLLELQPRALQMDLDDEHAQMKSMVPVPGDVRNAVARAVTPGAPRLRAIVEEAWPSVEHVTNLHRFFGASSNEELGENIRVMLDSTKLLYDPATMRNYPLSEYILKS